ILDAVVDTEYRYIRPRVVASRRSEVIPVGFVPPRPGHHVDTGPTTEHLAHRQQDRSTVDSRARLRHETPIAVAAQVQWPLQRIVDFCRIIESARLQQQNVDLRDLGEAARAIT